MDPKTDPKKSNKTTEGGRQPQPNADKKMTDLTQQH